jgi:glycerol-3-phosphate acyltransferase PlsX
VTQGDSSSSPPAPPGHSHAPVIAVDCNGADLGPAEVAAGAAIALGQGARMILFGPAGELGELPEEIEVVDAPVSIAKAPDPVSAARTTPEASIVQAARAVAGSFNIRRARGIYRPALAIPLPVPRWPVTLLDVGANAEARREHLVQFAFMGAALSRTVLGVRRPRVALLSNGEEAARGGALVVEAHAELRRRADEGIELFEFVGKVEGNDVVSGKADVIVTDGLTGNVALKLMEGVSQSMLGAIRHAATSSARGKLGGALLRSSLRGLRAEIDPEASGGAYLLGLRRLGVVPHGRFTRAGFAQAILRAQRGAREDVVAQTHRALEQADALRRAPASASAASLPQAQ